MTDYKSLAYARELALACVPNARLLFAATGRVGATTFFLAQRHPGTLEPFSPPRVCSVNLSVLTGGFGQDVARAAQLQTIEKADALAIVHVFEAWQSAEGEVFLDAAGTRQGVVCVSLEHAEGETSWTLPVTAEGLGEPCQVWSPSKVLTGYFNSKELTP